MKSVITHMMIEQAMALVNEIYDAYVQRKRETGECEVWFHSDAAMEKLAGYGYCIGQGMTRIVWICDDFVLKFPITYGHTHYCEKEADVYKAAEKRGLEGMFAQCEYLTECGGVPIWIMEIVDINEDDVYANSEYHQSGEDEDNEYWEYDCCEGARQMLERDWGVDEVEMLYRFLDEYAVNDVHDNNIGCDGRRYIICDYAGF